MIGRTWILVVAVLLLSVYERALGADAGSEWQRVTAAAKKEGKVVIGAPPGSDFRNEAQAALKKRFDIDSEFIQAPGPALMSKIVAEKQAGAVSVDAFLIGPCTGNSLLKADIFEPLPPAMILPEVRDPGEMVRRSPVGGQSDGKEFTLQFRCADDAVDLLQHAAGQTAGRA